MTPELLEHIENNHITPEDLERFDIRCSSSSDLPTVRELMKVQDVTQSLLRQLGEVVGYYCKTIGEIFQEIFGDMPRYMMYEALHPRKKPRGSIRRRRREKRDNE